MYFLCAKILKEDLKCLGCIYVRESWRKQKPKSRHTIIEPISQEIFKQFLVIILKSWNIKIWNLLRPITKICYTTATAWTVCRRATGNRHSIYLVMAQIDKILFLMCFFFFFFFSYFLLEIGYHRPLSTVRSKWKKNRREFFFHRIYKKPKIIDSKKWTFPHFWWLVQLQQNNNQFQI